VEGWFSREICSSCILLTILFKILVAVFSSEYNSDEVRFWKDFSKPDSSTGEIIHLNWSEICLKAKKIRERIDSEDATAARAKYNGKNGNPAFEMVFSYRKSSKEQRCIMKSEADIARKYRMKENATRPWDDGYKLQR
jgi:hypothetical protein